MPPPSRATYRFGSFELRAAEHVLTRAGERVPLSPKAIDLLTLLVERAGRVVDKHELLDTLWPGTFVEEANLSVQVAAARKALGGGADEFIETIAKRGYRFVAGVEEVASDRRPPVKLLVLPLQIVDAAAGSEFLAFSLPDAIAGTLAENPAICVVGGRDRNVASAGADAILRGTLGEVAGAPRVQVTLLDARTGATLTTVEGAAPLSGLYDLQRQVTRAVEEHLVAVDTRVRQRATLEHTAVPRNPGAYVFYLRANQLAYETSQWTQARDLYEACLEEDPTYAPAWARLARCHRVIGKFGMTPADARAGFERAEAAFQRAFILDSTLSLAHSLYAQLEVDTGKALEAMLRLLRLALERPHAADLYAGLVHAFRSCGLLDCSVAAYARARALDPGIPTSIHHTWWMKGDYASALNETVGDIGYMPGLALASAGRTREAIAALRWRERESADTRVAPYLASLRALLEGSRDESLAALEQASAGPLDAEAIYYMARSYAKHGETDRALQLMERVIDGGFVCHVTFAQDPWLDAVRGSARFVELLARSRAQAALARRAFEDAGGPAALRG